MKTTLNFVLLFLFFVAAAALGCAALDWRARRRATQTGKIIDAEAMLDAIAAVESGNNWHTVGRYGERGRCQFTATLWACHTNAPFEQWAPVDCDLTRRVERAHLDLVCTTLRGLNLELDPALVAAAWRHGALQAVKSARADFAKRAANFYWEAMGV